MTDLVALALTHHPIDHEAGDGYTMPRERWVECSCGAIVWSWQQFYEENDEDERISFAQHFAQEAQRADSERIAEALEALAEKPPLGVSYMRWLDRKLAKLHAILQGAERPAVLDAEAVPAATPPLCFEDHSKGTMQSQIPHRHPAVRPAVLDGDS